MSEVTVIVGVLPVVPVPFQPQNIAGGEVRMSVSAVSWSAENAVSVPSTHQEPELVPLESWHQKPSSSSVLATHVASVAVSRAVPEFPLTFPSTFAEAIAFENVIWSV